jgi:hypothetical protein
MKVVIAFAVIVAIGAPARAQPSAPGRALLGAAERASATVVGRVSDVNRIDGSGYAATLHVERVLAGAAPDAQRIGWEELAPSRPPRLAEGQRVLLALDDLPTSSLWRRRFPAADARVIAAAGDALLVDPSAADCDGLRADLALGRTAPVRVRAPALAALAADATLPLAAAAIDALARMAGVAAALDAEAARRLMERARDSGQPVALRRQIVRLTGTARMTAAVPQLEALARPGSGIAPDALRALAAIGDGLPADRVDALLARPEPDLRAVGAECASAAIAEQQLTALVRTDPSPAVRAAAAERLAATRTRWGVDGAVAALADADPSVRGAAAQALAALGAAAVPTLASVARTRPAEARGAIAALAMAGPPGLGAVEQLATDLTDPRLRDFARLALGRGPAPH